MESQYNLELDKVAAKIKSSRVKKVLIQLPDGLKPKATEIVDKLEQETSGDIMIWFDTCFGACDLPDIEKKDCDLIVQFGHSAWK